MSVVYSEFSPLDVITAASVCTACGCGPASIILRESRDPETGHTEPAAKLCSKCASQPHTAPTVSAAAMEKLLKDLANSLTEEERQSGGDSEDFRHEFSEFVLAARRLLGVDPKHPQRFCSQCRADYLPTSSDPCYCADPNAI